MLEIADDGRNDTYEDENGHQHVNTDHIQRSRLRIDARKWLASKMAPKKYGDRVEQAHSGGDKPIGIVNWILKPLGEDDGDQHQ
jgi:hypothetical protein